eukprot:357412-Chlamydomonas_euryale.AAC.10
MEGWALQQGRMGAAGGRMGSQQKGIGVAAEKGGRRSRKKWSSQQKRMVVAAEKDGRRGREG